MKKLSIFNYSWTTGIFWGLIGGLLVPLFPNLPFKTSTSEIVIMLTMGLMLLAALLTVKLNPSDNKFLKLFVASFLTFIIMPVVGHLILLLTNISTHNLQWVQLGPVFLFLLIGAVVCAAMSFFAFRRR